MTNTAFTATVDAGLFARVALAQSSEATRYYLNGVHIESAPNGAPGAFLVATDGHKMLVFYDRTATVSGGTAIVALPSDLRKRCKDGLVLAISNGAASVAGLQASGVLIDATFPGWRRVVPDIGAKPACHGVFDHKVIVPLAEALSTGKMRALTILGKDNESPHLVRGSHPDGFGVAMGIRQKAQPADTRLPDWFA